MSADSIRAAVMEQLNNLNEATQALIIPLPLKSLKMKQSVTLQMAVMQEEFCGNVRRWRVFTPDFEDQGAGGVQSGVLSYGPTVNPAVSQLLNSIDLCRRIIVLPSCLLLLMCGVEV